MKKYRFLFYPLFLLLLTMVSYSVLLIPGHKLSITAITIFCNTVLLLFYCLHTRKRLRPATGIRWPLLLLSLTVNAGLCIGFAFLARPRNIVWDCKFIDIFKECVVANGLFAFTEELIFREYLITNMKRLNWKPWICLTVSSLLFTMVHVSDNIPYWLTVFGIGLLMGWLYYRYAALEICIVLHWIYNSMIFYIKYTFSLAAASGVDLKHEDGFIIFCLLFIATILAANAIATSHNHKGRLWFLHN